MIMVRIHNNVIMIKTIEYGAHNTRGGQVNHGLNIKHNYTFANINDCDQPYHN